MDRYPPSFFLPDDEESAALPEVAPTSVAAKILNRQPQSLRKWACLGCGPIQPLRINGRLAWRLSDLKRLLKGGAK